MFTKNDRKTIKTGESLSHFLLTFGTGLVTRNRSSDRWRTLQQIRRNRANFWWRLRYGRIPKVQEESSLIHNPGPCKNEERIIKAMIRREKKNFQIQQLKKKIDGKTFYFWPRCCFCVWKNRSKGFRMIHCDLFGFNCIRSREIFWKINNKQQIDKSKSTRPNLYSAKMCPIRLVSHAFFVYNILKYAYRVSAKSCVMADAPGETNLTFLRLPNRWPFYSAVYSDWGKCAKRWQSKVWIGTNDNNSGYFLVKDHRSRPWETDQSPWWKNNIFRSLQIILFIPTWFFSSRLIYLKKNVQSCFSFADRRFYVNI